MGVSEDSNRFQHEDSVISEDISQVEASNVESSKPQTEIRAPGDDMNLLRACLASIKKSAGSTNGFRLRINIQKRIEQGQNLAQGDDIDLLRESLKFLEGSARTVDDLCDEIKERIEQLKELVEATKTSENDKNND